MTIHFILIINNLRSSRTDNRLRSGHHDAQTLHYKLYISIINNVAR